MRSILLVILSLLFNGCSQKTETEVKYIEPDYPPMKVLSKVPLFTPKYVMKDGYITMKVSEFYQASTTSQQNRKQNKFYRNQNIEYNKRFVK